MTATIAECIDIVEEGYQALLAYAAQGQAPRLDDEHPGPYIRDNLKAMHEAMQALISLLEKKSAPVEFEKLVVRDLHQASAVLNYVIGQPRIGSEIIDNLNASMHIRTVLADLFLLDESENPGRAQ